MSSFHLPLFCNAEIKNSLFTDPFMPLHNSVRTVASSGRDAWVRPLCRPPPQSGHGPSRLAAQRQFFVRAGVSQGNRPRTADDDVAGIVLPGEAEGESFLLMKPGSLEPSRLIGSRRHSISRLRSPERSRRGGSCRIAAARR
jgi:hypothetical protein